MALLLLFFLLLLAALPRDVAALTRRDFPDGFIFGAGSSAYQVYHIIIYAHLFLYVQVSSANGLFVVLIGVTMTH
jgi:hypothetical protein